MKEIECIVRKRDDLRQLGIEYTVIDEMGRVCTVTQWETKPPNALLVPGNTTFIPEERFEQKLPVD